MTLEPCSHHGRTPPCTEAVIEAGVARLVCCHLDPNPSVSGHGVERLRSVGIEVVSGVLAERAAELNLSFLIPIVERRPAVTLKWAMSLDGKIATSIGESQWISSEQGRRWALELREEHCAILVGSGTVLADDPRLNRRLGLANGAQTRAVMDRRLRTPAEARLLSVEGAVVIYTESADARRRQALERAGAEVVVLPTVSPKTVVDDLHGRGAQSLLVEGGGEILDAFARAGVFDRVAVCCASMLIGGRDATGPLGGVGVPLLERVPRLERLQARRRGVDLVISALRQGCLERLLQGLLMRLFASRAAEPDRGWARYWPRAWRPHPVSSTLVEGSLLESGGRGSRSLSPESALELATDQLSALDDVLYLPPIARDSVPSSTWRSFSSALRSSRVPWSCSGGLGEPESPYCDIGERDREGEGIELLDLAPGVLRQAGCPALAELEPSHLRVSSARGFERALLIPLIGGTSGCATGKAVRRRS